MEELQLGPNGGLVYCLEYLEANLDWLKERLDGLGNRYVLFDLPGQIELFTHHLSLRRIVDQLGKWNYRLAAVHLVDSHYCSDASKFISILLLSLSAMMQLELPHLNVLSKIDMIESMGRLDFNLDFFTEVQDLKYLLPRLAQSTRFSNKFTKLNEALIECIEDYSLVSFATLNIMDKESVHRILRLVDKANGFAFGGFAQGNEAIFEVADSADWQQRDVADVQERYMRDVGDFLLSDDEEDGEVDIDAAVEAAVAPPPSAPTRP